MKKKQIRARKESKQSSSSESKKSKQVREGTKPSGSRYQVIAHLENEGTVGPPVIAVVAYTGISSHDCVSPAKINTDLVSEGFEALKQAKKEPPQGFHAGTYGSTLEEVPLDLRKLKVPLDHSPIGVLQCFVLRKRRFNASVVSRNDPGFYLDHSGLFCLFLNSWSLLELYQALWDEDEDCHAPRARWEAKVGKWCPAVGSMETSGFQLADETIQWLIESGFQAQVNDLKIDPEVERSPGCVEFSPCSTEINLREPVLALPVNASGEGVFEPEISEEVGEPGEEAIPKEQGCHSPPPMFRSSLKESKGSVTVSEVEGENVVAGKGPGIAGMEIQQSIVEDEIEEVSPLLQVCSVIESLDSKPSNLSRNVLNLDAGNGKGDWPSEKLHPKVAKCGVFVDARKVLDEMPKQELVDYSLNVGSVISSAVEMESNFAGGSYTKVGNQYQGVENVKSTGKAPKEIEGKPSSLAVDQSSLARSSPTNRKWVDVVSRTQTKGPAIKVTSQSQGPVSKGARSGMELKFFAQSDNCLGIIDIDDDMIDEKPWIFCIVGYFLGPDMPFGLIRATARTPWGRFGLVDVFGNNNGFFFFQFQNFEAMECVLDNGPWLFSGRPIFLKKWKKCLSLTRNLVK
ncbi:Carboxylic ester hydrolase [Sarracenia purpurea var. burkii]